MEYVENDLVRVAKREKNTKRNYVVVNPLQGKHIPVSPSMALKLFTRLADSFRREYTGENLLLIGFAETATAIGAQAAVSLGTKYIQTTREVIPDLEYLVFSEEHSHATEQKLVKKDIDGVVPKTDRIVFIEDEVTTGKTILNIIAILEKLYPDQLSFSVASLLNGMSDKNLQVFEQKGIRLHYLVKTEHDTFCDRAKEFADNGLYYKSMKKERKHVSVLEVKNKMNAQRLVDALLYEKACEGLWNAVHQRIGSISNKNILVIGTEEFMYPALFIGKKLEELSNQVFCHSTTRSPIVVSLEKDYPLHSRYELKSLYDSERRTFLYDIGKYDKVFVVTDAPKEETEGVHTLLSALGAQNDHITLIRWC